MKHTEIVQKFQQLQLNLKFHHWNTLVEAQHLALESAYQSIVSFTDTVAETLIGKHGKLSPFDLLPTSSELSTTPEQIEAVALMLREYATEYKCYDLVNLSDEVMATGSKLRYLLRLS